MLNLSLSAHDPNRTLMPSRKPSFPPRPEGKDRTVGLCYSPSIGFPHKEGYMSICLRRRDFIAGLGSAAAAWPLTARAQQGDRVRRIGVLQAGDETDPVQKFIPTFTQALAGLGWTDGRNVRMSVRRSGGDINRMRAIART